MGHAVLHSGFYGDPKSLQRWNEGRRIYYYSATENGCYLVKGICLEVLPVEQLTPRACQVKA